MSIKGEDENGNIQCALEIINYNAVDYVSVIQSTALNNPGKLILNPHSGFVGIGTYVPNEKLHVNGSIKASDDVITDFFEGDGSSITNIQWKNINKPNGFVNDADADSTNEIQKLGIGTDGNSITLSDTRGIINGGSITVPYAVITGKLDGLDSSKFVCLNDSGNVGIGITSEPATQLHVGGTVKAQYFEGNGSKLGAVDADKFDGLDSNKFIIANDNGNVGIGTTTQNAVLQVNGAISRQGTTLEGSFSYTHVNLGINSSTGGDSSTVSGGLNNTASGDFYGVLCGRDNTASGRYSTVSGGYKNTVGGAYSWVGGKNMQLTANATGSFLWGYNNSPTPVTVTKPDSFIIYSGNVGIGKTDPEAKLDVNGTVKAPTVNITKVMSLTPQATQPAGKKGDLYVGTNGVLYFHNGTSWVSVVTN